jgi:UDP-2-acetamido-2,6-beta-L-arabino-hexul-4-ose reductase
MALATIEVLSFPADARGWVCEPIGLDELRAQKNVHVALTQPGAIRGNHYHQQSTEIIVVFGPALVRLREDQAPRDVRIPEGAAYRFTLPPGVAHAFQNTGAAPMLLCAFNTHVHDPANPDTVREILIPV